MATEHLHHRGETDRLNHTGQDIRFGHVIEWSEVFIGLSAIALVAVVLALMIVL